MDALFPLSLSEPEREYVEFLLGQKKKMVKWMKTMIMMTMMRLPPCKFALVTFLAALGDAPGVAGIDLFESL